MEIRRSALIGFPAERTFDLIEAAEHYPEFLPWCSEAVILARDETMVAARLTVSYRGLRFELTTRNQKRRPEWLAVRMEKGPFRRFEGEWDLKRLGSDACKIELAMRYEFNNALGRAAGRIFDGIADTIVDAFARRAEQQLRSEPPSSVNPNALRKLA